MRQRLESLGGNFDGDTTCHVNTKAIDDLHENEDC